MQGKRNARLQYLLQDADGSLTQVTDLSVLANFLAIGGDVSDYSSTTDSLEALSDAIGNISCADPFLASVGGALATAAATGAVSNAKEAMAYLKQLVTEQIIIDGFHDVQTANATTNAQMRDVIGNKTDAASRTADEASLVGLVRNTLNEATETKRHHHNDERWFGPAASASGTTHIADPLGEVGGTPAGVNTSFRITSGASKTWGTAVQVWGSTDYTLMPATKQAFLDMHRFRVTVAEADKQNWYLRIIVDDVSAAAGVTADTYGIVPIFVENTDKVASPIEMITSRISQTDATMVWVQALYPDNNDQKYIDLQFGIHGYPE